MSSNPFYDPEAALRDLELFHGDKMNPPKPPPKARWTEEMEQDFQAFHGDREKPCISN
jgi:hypothetical protein